MIKGIDVSEWQGLINWQKVKDSGIKFAIIRYADGLYIDRYFFQNMAAAKKVGLHIGSYIFSRATNEAQAREEAQRLIKACEPYDCDMPLYIDMEADNLKHLANKIVKAFMSECKIRKVKGGIYANLNWFNNYLDPEPYRSDPLWLAQYNDVITARDPSLFGMWQYSSSGSVPGISGNVDLNYCYVEYWENTSGGSIENSNTNNEIDKICASLSEKAKDVLAGKYGTGTARQKALGEYYTPIQFILNKALED